MNPQIHLINGIECITVADCAAYLGCRVGTVHNLRLVARLDGRKLDYFKVGSGVFIVWASAQAEKAKRTATEAVAA